MTIGQLKPGDTYASGRYRCRSNDGETVTVRRLSDDWLIEFKKGSVNWEHKVTLTLQKPKTNQKTLQL